MSPIDLPFRPDRLISGSASSELAALNDIISNSLLDVVFQPILELSSRNYLGHEALVRPRNKGCFAGPAEMFAAAEQAGLSNALDHVCRTRTFEEFASQQVSGTLFLNATPSSLHDPAFQNGETMALMRRLNITPSRVVIEITENQRISDFNRFRDALAHFRKLGYRIAIDDLGQGMSNLRMWTEIHPDFVKIDRHFIHGINHDPLKFQLVRAMHGMAETCGACIIAEGVEDAEDFRALRDIGIPYVQGFFVARPAPLARTEIPSGVLDALSASRIAVFPGFTAAPGGNVTADALRRNVEAVRPEIINDQVFARFEAEPNLPAIPVCDAEGIPRGIMERSAMIDRFARLYRREIYGRKPCSQLMDASPLLVDERMPIQDISRLVTSSRRSSIPDHFIITRAGRYAGLGSSSDMLALITDMQIRAARYANPLTQLPGNVPISEHIERLLASGAGFVACYADLDAFKPFNDVHGYRRGDDLIQLVAQLLTENTDPRDDFVGHIGGDDFLVLFQSQDWQARCERVLALFATRSQACFSDEDKARGGIVTEDRQGRSIFHALPTLSLGALAVPPGSYVSHHEISSAAAEAKRQAKRIAGNSLFVERRRFPPASIREAGEGKVS